MVEVNYSLKWPFISPNDFSNVQCELVAGPSFSNTEWMGHWPSAALLAVWGSGSVAERCEVWLPEPSWFSFSFSSSYLITQWPDSISGDGLDSVVPHQGPGGWQVVHLRFKNKNISNLALGLVGSLVLGGWLVESAGAQMSSAQIVTFPQISYLYLFLLLWLFLLTWLLQE